jgi:thiosulfate/3-mercaptopyruvate sulfurtransferase
LRAAAALPLSAPRIWSNEPGSDPWLPQQLLEPAAVAGMIRSGDRFLLVCVGFPFLYRQKHIAHAVLAGPGNKPEGIAALQQVVSTTPKGGTIVLYCGCCPMPQCPNLRPAFSALAQAGYSHVRVLNLPTNFRTDWALKGYPAEPDVPSAR